MHFIISYPISKFIGRNSHKRDSYIYVFRKDIYKLYLESNIYYIILYYIILYYIIYINLIIDIYLNIYIDNL